MDDLMQRIPQMEAEELIGSVGIVFDQCKTDVEVARARALISARGRSLHLSREITNLLKAYADADKKMSKEYTDEAQKNTGFGLSYNAVGQVRETIDNFLKILQHDEKYKYIKYNLLANCAEIHKNGEIIRWQDSDDSESKRHIESVYGISSDAKYNDAMKLFLRGRSYHPIKDIIDRLQWDGENRVEHFLSKWMKAEDTPYTREVSRLIFAGGINRLYDPGCKFDDTPVLIGTRQGEGKSSLIRWLALKDEFYGEATVFEGKESIEQLEGSWVCEISEMLALTKTKEKEAVKAYISRMTDKYRRPYEKLPAIYPRQCFFIGTTNKINFLNDRSGNRRFYPVKVFTSGYWLFDHEEECREYIEQCWAEAKYRFDEDRMPAFANPELFTVYRKMQNNSMEDDWREGYIVEWIYKYKNVGDLICIQEIVSKCLEAGSDPNYGVGKAARTELSQLLDNMHCVERCETIKRVPLYGAQRAWKVLHIEKLPWEVSYDDEEDEPFFEIADDEECPDEDCLDDEAEAESETEDEETESEDDDAEDESEEKEKETP